MEKNMNLKELKRTITIRRSHRSYTEALPSKVTLDKIENYFSELVPLSPKIDYSLRIIEREELRTTMAWFPPMAIALYSDTGEGYLENAGFILGQLDLYLQSIGLGSCFVGMGKPLDIQAAPEKGEFVMLLAFGETNDAFRSGEADFTRLDVTEITNLPDPLTTLARLAPSSLNSQPWYFNKTDDRTYRAYRKELVRSRNITRMNMIDVGIAASFLYIAAKAAQVEAAPPATAQFAPSPLKAFREDNPISKSGKQYLFTIEV